MNAHPKPRELRQPVAMAQQVLDFCREVEGERRKRFVKRSRDGQRVAGTVQEVGIPNVMWVAPASTC
jgi:hypothetical protein